jgi:Carboxypeptidase regulatory-like domain
VPRRLPRSSGLVGLVAAILAGAAITATATGATRDATAGATGTTGTPAGVIAGRVTGPDGQPLANITVAAAPAGNAPAAQLTQGTTDANGNYALVVAPGSYDVAFNALDPTDDAYASQVYGGAGPSAADQCQVCFGEPQVVANGQITGGIDAKLEPPMQKGTVRPLSGNTIRVIGTRMSFKFGCHEDGIGCEGKGVLRIGTSTKDPIVATEKFEVAPDHTMTLHFTVPSAVRAKLKKAKRNRLAAIVQLTTAPSSTTTKFILVDRP